MTYKVLTNFKALTDRGELEVQAGQIITADKDQAMKLINDGKIIPAEKAAYRVYSEILQAFLWVVDTDEDMKALRGKNVTEPIYTADEIRKLKSTSKEGLKTIHEAKKIFEDSKVEDDEPREET
jgi:membrane protease subunit (stomatin/prohibitin family)